MPPALPAGGAIVEDERTRSTAAGPRYDGHNGSGPDAFTRSVVSLPGIRFEGLTRDMSAAVGVEVVTERVLW